MLCYPTYFSPVAQYVAIAKADTLIFEVADNFQKQTYRNRCYIFGPNGKQLLNVPVLKANSKQLTKDVQIDDSEAWYKQHLKALDTAYRSSPFYEFYRDEVQQVLFNKEKFLLDLNLKSHDLIMNLLQLEIPYEKTSAYQDIYSAAKDFRFLANAKTAHYFGLKSYFQVFSMEHGYLENLSILDLLFMEGPSAINYLLEQELTL